MRLILTTIIPTILAQPILAVDMGREFKYCQTLSVEGSFVLVSARTES